MGQIVSDYPTSAEAFKYAGLDFEVEKLPNLHRLPNGNEVMAYGPQLYLSAQTADIQTTLIVTKGKTTVVSDGAIYNLKEIGSSERAYNQYAITVRKAFGAGLEVVAAMNSVAFRSRQSVREVTMKRYSDALKDYPETLYSFIIKNHDSPVVPLLLTQLFLNTNDVTKSKANSLIAILKDKKTGSEIRTATLTKLRENSDRLEKELGLYAGKRACLHIRLMKIEYHGVLVIEPGQSCG